MNKQKLFIIAVAVISVIAIAFYTLSSQSVQDSTNDIKDQSKEMYDYTKESKSDNDNEADAETESEDSEDSNEEDDESDIEDEDEEELDESDFEYDEDDIGYDGIEEDFNYEDQIKDKVGKKEYKKIMKRAEKAIKAYSVGDKEAFKDISTKNLYEILGNKENRLIADDKKYEYEVFPTEQTHPDDVIIGSMLNEKDEDNSKQINFIFVEEKDGYMIDKIVIMWET